MGKTAKKAIRMLQDALVALNGNPPFSLTLMAPSWCLGSAAKIIPLIARLSGILGKLPRQNPAF
jgi:hypothetical protein